jgi:hypothetical protein
MTRRPHSPGSTLVLRLNHETVHDFILLFMPPCVPHLTRLTTGSLERSLLVFSTPGGLTGNDLSRLFFTCTNTVKPQPALAILSQESVHTTLSITHHTRKRPSTGPRTTHGLQFTVFARTPRSTSDELSLENSSNSRMASTFPLHRYDLESARA